MKNTLKIIVLLLLGGVFGVGPNEVTSVSVMEGDPVTLHTDTKLQTGDMIDWRFKKADSIKLLVQISENKAEYQSSVDVSLKSRLQVDIQTGDLTIRNMRMKYSGLYEVEINNPQTSYKRFNVTVKESPRVTDAGASDVKSVSVKERDSVTLHTDVQTQRGDLILWRFGDKNVLIAKGDMEDNEISVYDDDDGRFSGRLKLDKSGNLTITNIRTSNTGVYNLKIISNRETKYKTFTVSISGGGWSSGAVAGICVLFLLVIAAVIAVGVILYRRKKPTDMMKVTEGDCLTLHAAGSKLQPGTQIKWKFNGRVIMTGEMTKDKGITKNNSNDQQFTSRLKWNRFIGDLIINAISQKDAGIYEVNITYNKETSHKRFKVNVTDAVISVYQGDTVILHAAKSELQTGTQIEWKYNGRVIMTGEMTEDTGITEIKSNDDQQFKNRLELDNHVGSLIISNISNDDTGLYEVNITYNKQLLPFKCQVNVIGIASFDRLLENMPVMMKVREGAPLTLSCAGDCELQTGAQIEWTFKDRVIMTGKMTEDREICVDDRKDQQFKNRLELHHFVGSLTIKPVSKEDSGFYEGKITYNGETSNKRFYVNVTYNAFRRQVADVRAEIKVPEGDRLTLNAAYSGLQIGAQIVWKFKDRVIMTGVMTEDTGIIEINCDDPQFSDRLELESYHGYLIINNISRKDIGLYEGKIINNKKTSCYKTQVNVIDAPRALPDDVPESVKTVYGVVNVVEKDSARTYRNDPGVDIPLLKKV